MSRAVSSANTMVMAVIVGCLAGCGGGQASTGPVASAPTAKPKTAVPAYVLAQFDVTVHSYPAAAVPPTGFAVTDTGLVLVPVGGGVFAAGWSGWLIEPQQSPIRGVDSSGTALVVAEASEQGTQLARWEKRKRVGELGRLPAGAYQVALTPKEALWVAGRTAKGTWVLEHGAPGRPLDIVDEGTEPIRAIAPAGESAAVIAVGDRIVLVRRGAAPKLLAHTKDPVEGVAVTGDGAVHFTTAGGLYRIDAERRLRILAAGLHGPLRVERGSIYVMRREANQVIQLTPPPSMRASAPAKTKGT